MFSSKFVRGRQNPCPFFYTSSAKTVRQTVLTANNVTVPLVSLNKNAEVASPGLQNCHAQLSSVSSSCPNSNRYQNEARISKPSKKARHSGSWLRVLNFLPRNGSVARYSIGPTPNQCDKTVRDQSLCTCLDRNLMLANRIGAFRAAC